MCPFNNIPQEESNPAYWSSQFDINKKVQEQIQNLKQSLQNLLDVCKLQQNAIDKLLTLTQYSYEPSTEVKELLRNWDKPKTDPRITNPRDYDSSVGE
jgi:K+-sensing histidine kinase KdpD